MGCCHFSPSKLESKIENAIRVTLAENAAADAVDSKSSVAKYTENHERPAQISDKLQEDLIVRMTEIFEFAESGGINANVFVRCHGDHAFLPRSFYSMSGLCAFHRDEVVLPHLLSDFILCVVDYFRFSKPESETLNSQPFFLPPPSSIENVESIKLRNYVACRKSLYPPNPSDADVEYITPGAIVVCELLTWCIQLTKKKSWSNADSMGDIHLITVRNYISQVLAEVISSRKNSFVSIPTSPLQFGFTLKLAVLRQKIIDTLFKMTPPQPLHEIDDQ